MSLEWGRRGFNEEADFSLLKFVLVRHVLGSYIESPLLTDVEGHSWVF